ncbi:unnamed protein product [Periconia digitata]|uniref:Uncharacterized protein n=1 Tax=Periconia digitata TaxID=1303443 RepID=A0A9W4UFU0_9PLEO|nr:unnamed protein product [Periconia digitata]
MSRSFPRHSDFSVLLPSPLQPDYCLHVPHALALAITAAGGCAFIHHPACVIRPCRPIVAIPPSWRAEAAVRKKKQNPALHNVDKSRVFTHKTFTNRRFMTHSRPHQRR